MFFKFFLILLAFVLFPIHLAVAVEDTEKKSNHYETLIKNKMNLYFKFIEKNEETIAEISIMGANNQYIRNYRSIVFSKLEKNPKEFKKFTEYNMSLMEDIDKVNQIRLPAVTELKNRGVEES